MDSFVKRITVLGSLLATAISTGVVAAPANAVVTRSESNSVAVSPPRVCPERKSNTAYITIVNKIDGPIVMQSKITEHECTQYWSGKSNPSLYNGLHIMPNETIATNLRLEPASSTMTLAYWNQRFMLTTGAELLSVNLKLYQRDGKGGGWYLGGSGKTRVTSWPLNAIGLGRGTLTITRSPRSDGKGSFTMTFAPA